MRRRLGLGLLLLVGLARSASAQAPVHHVLDVRLDDRAGRIAVTADVTAAAGDTEVEFLLHARLRVTRSAPTVRERPLGDVRWLGEIEGGAPGAAPPMKRYA